MKTYITLTALGNYIDIKELTVGEELILEKDKENQYDDEAIKVMGTNHSKKGYVANFILNVKEPTQQVISTTCLMKHVNVLLDLFMTKELSLK